MGCSYYARFVIGVKFNKNDLVSQTPNPLYGKYKFDPESGKKVEKFISDRSILDYVSKFIDNSKGNTSVELYESEIVFYGRVTTADAEGPNCVKIKDYHVDSLPKEYPDFIYFLNENKIPYEEGCFVISDVSC